MQTNAIIERANGVKIHATRPAFTIVLVGGTVAPVEVRWTLTIDVQTLTSPEDPKLDRADFADGSLRAARDNAALSEEEVAVSTRWSS